MSTIEAQNAQTTPAHRFTVDEYRAMGPAGVLREDDRVELLNGVVVDMTPIGYRHAIVLGKLNTLFVRRFDQRAFAWNQLPIQMDDHSEPAPDLSLLKLPETRYTDRLPVAADALLVIEVSETTLRQDRGVKAVIYARSGIAEYWIVNLTDAAVEVHREPDGDSYKSVATFRKNDRIAPLAFPEDALNIADFLA